MARRRRQTKTRNDKVAGVGLAAIGLALLAALIGASFWIKTHAIPIDDATNCPLAGPRAVHAIIIDQSDAITGQQAQQIRQLLTKVRRDAAFGTRFDIYTFEGNATDELQTILSVCAPGKPEDANDWYENPDLIRKNYEQNFVRIIDGALDTLLQTDTLPTSPIMESIRASSITSFAGTDVPRENLKLTLISDMIQNSPHLSQFRSDAAFEQFAKAPAWPGLRPHLRGVAVRILYLMRPEAARSGKPIQSRGHQAFWEELIAASGGTIESFEPL